MMHQLQKLVEELGARLSGHQLLGHPLESTIIIRGNFNKNCIVSKVSFILVITSIRKDKT
jgi:hypothetical protein